MSVITRTANLPDSANKADFYSLIDSATVGSIANADIAAGAAIADTKFATISTAGKVSGAALTALANIPSGAGLIPVANIDVGTAANKIVQLTAAAKLPAVDGSLLTGLSGNIKVGTFNHDFGSKADQTVSSIGFTPKAVIFFFARHSQTQSSYGADNGTTAFSVYIINNTSVNFSTSYSIINDIDGGTNAGLGKIKSLASDQFVIDWSNSAGTLSGSLAIGYVALG